MQSGLDRSCKFATIFILLTSYSSVLTSASHLKAKDLGRYQLNNTVCSRSQTQALTADLYLSSYSYMLTTANNVPNYVTFEGYRFGDYVYGESAVLNNEIVSGFIYNRRSTPYLYGIRVGNTRLVAYDLSGNHYDLLTRFDDRSARGCVD
jgi:hypothetical protein